MLKQQLKRDKDTAWYEVSNWLLHADHSPKLEKALVEFMTRLDDDLFNELSSEDILILDCATEASTVRTLTRYCKGHRKLKEHKTHIIVFRRGLQDLSPRAVLGEVAHEFGHLISSLRHDVKTGLPATLEQEADALAKGWGFAEEIEANRAELEIQT